MTLLPEVRDRLVATATELAEETHPSRLGRRSRALAPAIAVILTIGVVAVILLTVHTNPGSHVGLQPARPGPVPPAPKSAWVHAMSQAETETLNHDRACRASSGPAIARYRYTAPAPGITAELPALGNPPPTPQRVTPTMLRSHGALARGVYIRYARTGEISGVRYYLLPAAQLNGRGSIPSRCYVEQRAAFQHRATHFPPDQRPAAMRYEDGALQTQRAMGQPLGVCLLYMGPGLSGQGCRSIAAMRLRPTDVTGSGGDNHQTITALVVPNAVASVTAHYSAESQIGRVARHSVTKRPDHNVVIFRLVGGWDPPTLTFKSANGKVLQTTPQQP